MLLPLNLLWTLKDALQFLHSCQMESIGSGIGSAFLDSGLFVIESVGGHGSHRRST